MQHSIWTTIIAKLALPLFLLTTAAPNFVAAQTAVKPQIKTNAESPVTFDLAAFTGKTVFVFHWRTNCPVCLDKMEELRSNLAGWRSKPFVVLMVNHDRSRQDFQSYLAIQKTILGTSPQMIHVYDKDLAVDSLYKGSSLPTSFVIDDKQTLRFSYMGRIPADAWNDISDLLP